MSTLGNIKNNISPKARMMLGLTIVGIAGVVGYSFIRLGSSGAPTNSDGVAKLNLPPSKEEISRDKPLDKVRFDDKSAVGQIYKQDEENRAETALKQNTSHVDEIRLRLDQETVKPAEPVKPVEPAQSKLDLLKAERRKTEDASKREQQSQAARQSQTVFQENPWKTFLDAEKSQYAEYETALSSAISGLKAPKPLPTPNYDAMANETNAKKGTRGSTSGSSTGGSSSSGGYEQYLTSNSGVNEPVQGSAQRSLRGEQAQVAQHKKVRAADPVADDEDEGAGVELDYPSERIAKAVVTAPKATGKIPVGQTFYSVLQIGVNTDEISPIRAVSIEKGRLEGAVLTGEPKRTGEKAILNFTSMSLKGRSYNVNAIALDPDTYRSGIADGVDTHAFERYSKLFISSFVQGYGDALSGTQTTTNTDGSSSQTKDPLPDSSSQIKVGIGEIGRKMSPIFQKEFDRPPTVTVEPNKNIIIMFMQEVDLDKEM